MKSLDSMLEDALGALAEQDAAQNDVEDCDVKDSDVEDCDVEKVEAGDIDFETLIAYRDGRLDAGQEVQVQRALVRDPALAQALLDLDAVDLDAEHVVDLERLDDLAGNIDVDDRRQDQAWHRFEASLTASESSKSPQSLPPGKSELARPDALELRSTPFRSFVARYPFASLAASFLLAVALTWFGLGPLIMEPTPGLLAFEHVGLQDGAGPMRGGGIPTVRLVDGTRVLLLGLESPPALSMPDALPLEAEAVVRRSGVEIARRAVRLEDEGFYLLDLPAGELADGLLEIELLDPAQQSRISSYRVQLFSP